MKTKTIKQIEEQIGKVDEALKNFVPKQHEGYYGEEQEHTAKSLKANIKAVLMSIRGLIKAHDRFVQLYSRSERDNIHGCLSNIDSSLNGKKYNDTANHLDQLKPIIRNCSIRGSLEIQEVLEERVHQINAQYSGVEESINTIERIREQAEQAGEKIKSEEEKTESLGNTLDELQRKSEQITSLQEESKQNHQTIKEVLTSVKSHEEIINSFVKRVEKREQQLDKQEQSTTSYQEKLTLFETEHKEKLDNAEILINQARNALEYTTAQGISAAFAERYNEDKNKKSWWWLVVGGACVLGGIGISVWWLAEKNSVDFFVVISRITVMFVTFSSAWFCAGQYVKYKNTMEDYGYKAVLAKSMMAFLEQLTGEERERYLEMVLLEIHKDPLRKKHDIPTPVSKLVEAIRKKTTDD